LLFVWLSLTPGTSQLWQKQLRLDVKVQSLLHSSINTISYQFFFWEVRFFLRFRIYSFPGL
jgi:hypothetical protein